MQEEGDDHEDGPVLHHVCLHTLIPVIDIGDMGDVHGEESLGDREVRFVNVEVTEGDSGQVEQDSVAHQTNHKQHSVELKQYLLYTSRI